MAAQQLDQAQALATLSQAAAGGSNSGSNSEPVIRTRSQAKSQPSVKIKKVARSKRKTKRSRREISPSEESNLSRDLGNHSITNPPIMIPCRYNCGMYFNYILEKDTHVRNAHAQPRVDQLAPRTENLQPALNTVVPGFRDASQMPPLSPLPVVVNQCEFCKSYFATPGDLKTHKDRKHTQPALTCPIASCKVSLASETELVTHITMAHQTSPPISSLPQANLTYANSGPSLGNLSNAMSNLSLSTATRHLSSLAAPPSLVNQLGQNLPNAMSASSWSQPVKSGLDRMSNHRARVHVLWPHECIDSILAKRTFSYKDLSGSALAAGSIAALFQSNKFYQCPEAIQVYLQHLSFLFHCLSYSNNVPAILDFHASILSQIEAGILTWSNSFEQTFTMQRLNFRASLKDIPVFSSPSSSNNSAKPNSKAKNEDELKRKEESRKVICRDFTNGTCTKQGDHDGKKHVCHYCWWKREMYNEAHYPFACPMDPNPKRK